MIQDTVKCTLSPAITGKTYKYCIYLCEPGGERKMNKKMGADTHAKLQVYIPVCSFASAAQGIDRHFYKCTGQLHLYGLFLLQEHLCWKPDEQK